MMPNLSSLLVAPKIVVMATYSAAGDDTVSWQILVQKKSYADNATKELSSGYVNTVW